MKNRSAFTLIELIIVVAIIAILVAAIFVALDPARRLQSTRNSTRWTDTRAILEAVKKYQVDEEGEWPSTAVAVDDNTGTVQMIGEGGIDCASIAATCPGVSFPSTSCFASGLDTDLEDYISDIPVDPKDGSDAVTYYYINKDANGFIIVGSCKEEGMDKGGTGTPPTIEVRR